MPFWVTSQIKFSIIYVIYHLLSCILILYAAIQLTLKAVGGFYYSIERIPTTLTYIAYCIKNNCEIRSASACILEIALLNKTIYDFLNLWSLSTQQRTASEWVFTLLHLCCVDEMVVLEKRDYWPLATARFLVKKAFYVSPSAVISW